MGFWDKLKDLVKIDLSRLTSLVHIEINNNSNNRSSNKYEINEESKTLGISINKLTAEEKRKLKEIIELQLQENTPLLETKSKQTVDDIKSKEASSKEILEFFSDKLSDKDLKIIKAALYVREVFNDAKSITRLKAEIIRRYGDYGRNVTNLCSANYFEEWIIPAYQELKKTTPDKEELKRRFQKFYSTIVNELPFTEFIGRATSLGEIEEIITDKIMKNIEYGHRFFNIHGIGRANIDKIREIVQKLEQNIPGLHKSIQEEDNIILVKMEFRKPISEAQ